MPREAVRTILPRPWGLKRCSSARSDSPLAPLAKAPLWQQSKNDDLASGAAVFEPLVQPCCCDSRGSCPLTPSIGGGIVEPPAVVEHAVA